MVREDNPLYCVAASFAQHRSTHALLLNRPFRRKVLLQVSIARLLALRRDTLGEELGHGTKIQLFLKENQLEFLEEHRLNVTIRWHTPTP